MEPVIMVGLDGSPESLAAARWAAAEAERRNLSLNLVYAWAMLAPEPTRVPSEIHQNYWANRLVHHTQAELQAHHPDLPIVGSLIADDAQDALLRAASKSELIALGSRGLTSAESYFLGSIAMAVVARATRPVVLVRSGARSGKLSLSSGDVVVALKLNDACDELLEFSFVTAAARGVPLHAVHGQRLPSPALPGRDRDVGKKFMEDAQRQLGQVLRPWHEKFPSVELIDGIHLESPAESVVRASDGAGVLVVGRRRHRSPLAPRLGPVAQAALSHAPCPVAVVPHD